MYTRTRFALVLSVLVAVLLAGCGGTPATSAPAATRAPAVVAPTRAAEATKAPAAPVPTKAQEPVQGATAPAATMVASPVATAQAIEAGGDAALTVPERPNRLIVKNAEVKLLVADTDVAIDRVTQVAADVGGYIISSRVRYDEWLGKKYKFASITLGVPVDQFELAMRRVRSIALRVMDETASGQDVTDEYVDLQSRLGNLEATRDRIRKFLDQAQTVEESLRVNQQLAAVEGEIEQVKGRKNYLFDRSAYSTITIQIDPDLPQPTPEPTATPSPTPMPTPIPTPTPTSTPTPEWTPAQTVQEAGGVLGSIVRVVVQMTIWLVIVGVPVLAPVALALWAVERWANRRRKRQIE